MRASQLLGHLEWHNSLPRAIATLVHHYLSMSKQTAERDQKLCVYTYLTFDLIMPGRSIFPKYILNRFARMGAARAHSDVKSAVAARAFVVVVDGLAAWSDGIQVQIVRAVPHQRSHHLVRMSMPVPCDHSFLIICGNCVTKHASDLPRSSAGSAKALGNVFVERGWVVQRGINRGAILPSRQQSVGAT